MKNPEIKNCKDCIYFASYHSWTNRGFIDSCYRSISERIYTGEIIGKEHDPEIQRLISIFGCGKKAKYFVPRNK